jgi:hypothetical protein
MVVLAFFLEQILKVIPTTKKVCEQFVTSKHYSRRASIFWAGFALEEDGMITGVAVYGQPSPPVQKHAFLDRDFRLFELARVVVQSKTKNAASFLVGNSLKQLEPRPCAVISYADTEQSHCGIIYQATNWTYTGATRSHDKAYMVDGKRTHPMTLRDRGITDPTRWARENGIEMVKPMEKHRYMTFVGDKSEKQSMLKRLNYPVIKTYPKCNQRRYDDGPELMVSSSYGAPINAILF